MKTGKILLGAAAIGGVGFLIYKLRKPSNPIPPEPYFIWDFPNDGVFARQVPSTVTAEIVLAELDPVYIPGEVSVVWYMNELWFRPGWPESTLESLVPGETYTVVVSGACVWNIPVGG